MQLKWLEDFIVLAQERSFTRAAELRHVTHPAFGRRIRALEAWAGTPLVERGSGGPVTLTPAGQSFLETAGHLARSLTQSHEELQSLAGRQARTVTLATGRTLARTVVADWLVRLQPILQGGELCIRTRALADTVGMLERNEADFSLVYHHPALAIRLDARQFTHLTVASDRLVPVSRATAQGQALHRFGPDATRVPYLAYAPQLALGRLVEDHLAHNPHAPRLQRVVECDSADAHYEYVQKGLGVAWLPWSMVFADCKAQRLALAGDSRMEVRFDVRLYRPKRRLGPLAEALWKALAQR
ncbi:DNA-binding transcriptional LysR family regulator [Acidovorax delafieldii]|uniref:DNA-binding transcriptional LysR family regulator n=1 Tax=Acidovorax delafieldii TaxID=47920 RepID=A0A561XUY0_ACIDE|nr:LysR family transcriptional regulator [Acidovorax delafieldii]TWG39889.1 DNA-binding transcriptional LysR family regulator [Acidovorax delafieldii]